MAKYKVLHTKLTMFTNSQCVPLRTHGIYPYNLWSHCSHYCVLPTGNPVKLPSFYQYMFC